MCALTDPLDRPFHFTYPVKESLKAVEEMSARVGWGSHGVYVASGYTTVVVLIECVCSFSLRFEVTARAG